MPGYIDLTQPEQDAVDELLSLVRPIAHELYRFAQKNRVVNQLWFSIPEGSASTLADLIAGMTAGELLPNKSGLAGSDQVTKEALQTVMGYVGTVAAHDSANHLNVLLPFGGSVNFVG